jgi:TatD DNase family protein
MIDAHAHLNEIKDIDSAIHRALGAGVERIVAVGMEAASNRETLALSERFPGIIFPAIGYHPWSITPEGVEENVSFIRDHLAACVALGEVGLDYKAKVKKNLQREVFSQVLKIAAEHNKPVIIHNRFSHERAYRMLLEADIQKAVFHWYNGPLDLLSRLVADGYYVSATPALSYSPPHQEAIREAPLDRILTETDAPVEYQGNISEPADLLITLQELARLKNLDWETVARRITANARGFFDME